ncbi:hypothetical protein C0J52_08008 [Blattella germanica]|nr:hypothetical protein C0J52_08008 [Blattella germanica]
MGVCFIIESKTKRALLQYEESSTIWKIVLSTTDKEMIRSKLPTVTALSWSKQNGRSIVSVKGTSHICGIVSTSKYKNYKPLSTIEKAMPTNWYKMAAIVNRYCQNYGIEEVSEAGWCLTLSSGIRSHICNPAQLLLRPICCGYYGNDTLSFHQKTVDAQLQRPQVAPKVLFFYFVFGYFYREDYIHGDYNINRFIYLVLFSISCNNEESSNSIFFLTTCCYSCTYSCFCISLFIYTEMDSDKTNAGCFKFAFSRRKIQPRFSYYRNTLSCYPLSYKFLNSISDHAGMKSI